MAGFNGFGGANMQNLIKQAQKMQEQMQQDREELENTTFYANAGGGMVEVEMNGKRELTSLKIKPEVIDPEDAEMLEDLIMAAVNEAIKMAEEASSAMMGKMTAGLGGGMPF